jgi:hypothetical protein
MNKFFEFHNYLDRFNNRPYYKGTWEKLQMEAFRLLPFQYKKSSAGLFSMFQDTTDISTFFISGTDKITSWTLTGGGPFSSVGSVITSWTMAAPDYITSNTIALTTGDKIYYKIDGNFNSGASIKIEIKNLGGTVVKSVTGVTANVELTYTAAATENHTVVMTCENSSGTITSANTSMFDTVLDIYEGTNDYVSYDGSVLYDMVTNGECSFSIISGDEEFYSEDCDVGCVNSVDKFTGDATDTDKSFELSNGDVMTSEAFEVNNGDTVNAYFDCDITNASDYTVELIQTGESDVSMTGTQNGDIWTYTGVSTGSGDAQVKITVATVSDTTIDNYDIEKGYSDRMITINVSSTVDYGGIHYAESGVNVWAQKFYKKANVRRSTNPRITVIGEEPNGKIKKEKTITSTKYKTNLKVIEPEFDALLTSVAATVTIVDQSGKTFTCENMEINEPDWNHGNGMTEFSFLDNTSVHTLNNSAL